MIVRPTMSLRADAPQPMVLLGARAWISARDDLSVRCSSNPALADRNGGTQD